MVILSHVGGFGGIALDGLSGMGSSGVLIFFAISGFVIPSSLRGTRWQGVKHFWVRRFWRLYPPFWIALLLTWWLHDNYSTEQWFWDAVMLPSQGVIGKGFQQFWTLEIELVFYCLVAALFFVFGRLSWEILLSSYFLLALLAALPFLVPSSVSGRKLMILYLMVMFWGAICREILYLKFSRWSWLAPVSGVNWARSILLGLHTGLLVSGSTARFLLDFWESGFRFAKVGLIAFSILGFLFWVVFSPVRIAWLSHVGRWTYSTYLLHMLVASSAYKMIEVPFISELPYLPLLYKGSVLVLSFAVGAVAYRWIEQPSDAIGKRLAARPSIS